MMTLPSKEESLILDKIDNAKTREEKIKYIKELMKYKKEHPEPSIE